MSNIFGFEKLCNEFNVLVAKQDAAYESGNIHAVAYNQEKLQYLVKILDMIGQFVPVWNQWADLNKDNVALFFAIDELCDEWRGVY